MLFLLPGLSFAQSASPVQSWFSVTIGTPEAIPTAVSDVKLKVTGNAVPETSYGLKMHGKDPRAWSGSVFRATSHSGETVEINLISSKEYDLSKPGKYTVQVQDRRPVVQRVKSNILTITVLP